MKSVAELYSYLDGIIPRKLSCDWDNDGIMCMSDPDRKAMRVLLALDITEKVCEYAVENSFDVIISHHPLIFKALKSLDGGDSRKKRLFRLIKNDIAAFSFHTRLDASEHGVNTALAEKLGIVPETRFGEENEMIGLIGRVPETELAPFARYVGETLGSRSLTYYDGGRKVGRVAILGGEGKDFISFAIRAGADTFVTGEASYNAALDGAQDRLNIILAGHYETEAPVLESLKTSVNAFDGSIDCRIIDSAMHSNI